MTGVHTPVRVTIVATPEAQVAPLSGLYETLNAFGLLAHFEPDIPVHPFQVEIVAPGADLIYGASGLPIGVHGAFDQVERTDIAIVPLMMLKGPDWVPGRYPGLVDWLRRMHRRGATLCSACTGALLLAETGLLDGRAATIHWAFAPMFQRHFPQVRVRTEEVLITAGERSEFVMTGGVMSWHDLALYLIARHVGPSAAQGMARLFMLQWHADRQTPYMFFAPTLDHGDSAVRHIQEWLSDHYAVPNPVETMVDRSGLPRRTLERRFHAATGYSPMAYVQQLRMAEARRQLEQTSASVECIAYAVGYENTAFFRRVFRRMTHLTPGAYRRKFQLPDVRGVSVEI